MIVVLNIVTYYSYSSILAGFVVIGIISYTLDCFLKKSPYKGVTLTWSYYLGLFSVVLLKAAIVEDWWLERKERTVVVGLAVK